MIALHATAAIAPAGAVRRANTTSQAQKGASMCQNRVSLAAPPASTILDR